MDSFFFFLLFLLISVPVVRYMVNDDPFSLTKSITNAAAVGFFEESVDINDLQGRYDKVISGEGKAKDKIRILIVPGHDEKNYGTSYKNLKEVNLNRRLAEHMAGFFGREQGFRVTLAADRGGFNKKLEEYLDREESNIKDFESFYKKTTAKLEERGEISLDQHVAHNTASSDTVFMLYGINKFANDEDFDIVIHVHFNDYPGRGLDDRGKYKGLSVYIPEPEFSNGRASRPFANKIFERLTKFFPRSTNPVEAAGVIEDSELIAIGAFNTADPIALLIEYGYVYEPQITNPELRDAVLKEMAYQTFVGTKSFFEPEFALETTPTLLIPNEWSINLEKRAPQNTDVLSLEALLKIGGFFPGPGETLESCPIDGDFDDCTKNALISFQNNYGLKATGALDSSTRDFINGIF